MIQAFQDAEPGCRQFKIRLLEMLARSIHQIAAGLFALEPKLHQGDVDSVVSFREPTRYSPFGKRMMVHEYPEPQPTIFFHYGYQNHEQYPHGVADMAAYWAEDRIFGGVVVFDRGESGTEAKDVYLHPGRKRTTMRIWILLDRQLDALTAFLLADPPPLATSPLPILAGDSNHPRYDDWDAIARLHIFRDPWERVVPEVKPDNGRDVVAYGDYPEIDAVWDGIEAAIARGR